MKNFEEALRRIESLEIKNLELKNQLKAVLWTSSSSSVEDTVKYTNIQVGSSSKITKDMESAMNRFTERMKNEAAKYKKGRNG